MLLFFIFLVWNWLGYGMNLILFIKWLIGWLGFGMCLNWGFSIWWIGWGIIWDRIRLIFGGVLGFRVGIILFMSWVIILCICLLGGFLGGEGCILFVEVVLLSRGLFFLRVGLLFLWWVCWVGRWLGVGIMGGIVVVVIGIWWRWVRGGLWWGWWIWLMGGWWGSVMGGILIWGGMGFVMGWLGGSCLCWGWCLGIWLRGWWMGGLGCGGGEWWGGMWIGLGLGGGGRWWSIIIICRSVCFGWLGFVWGWCWMCLRGFGWGCR